MEQKRAEHARQAEEARETELVRAMRWAEAEKVRREKRCMRLRAEAEGRIKREAADRVRLDAQREEAREELARQARERRRREEDAEDARIAAQARVRRVARETAKREQEAAAIKQRDADARRIVMRIGVPAAAAGLSSIARMQRESEWAEDDALNGLLRAALHPLDSNRIALPKGPTAQPLPRATSCPPLATRTAAVDGAGCDQDHRAPWPTLASIPVGPSIGQRLSARTKDRRSRIGTGPGWVPWE